MARQKGTDEWNVPIQLGEPTPEDRRNASLVAAAHATDSDDLKDLLQVLGLDADGHNPQA